MEDLPKTSTCIQINAFLKFPKYIDQIDMSLTFHEQVNVEGAFEGQFWAFVTYRVDDAFTSLGQDCERHDRIFTRFMLLCFTSLCFVKRRLQWVFLLIYWYLTIWRSIEIPKDGGDLQRQLFVQSDLRIASTCPWSIEFKGAELRSYPPPSQPWCFHCVFVYLRDHCML